MGLFKTIITPWTKAFEEAQEKSEAASIPLAQKGAAGGVAELNSAGHLVGNVLPQYVAPPPSGSAVTDTANLKTAIATVIATGGSLILWSGTYKITETLAFGAMKGTNKAVTMEGTGAGNRFGGIVEGGTVIENESGGSAITGYGTYLSGVSKPIVSLNLGGFIIANTIGIGANYTIDLDYVTQFGLLGEIYIEGNKHTGNGFRLRNTTNGGGLQSQILAHGFEQGTGHYFASEVTTNVETALNSGNSVHLNMQAIQCLVGVDVEGTTLFNSVSSLCIKCVNETDIVGSIGIKHGEQAMQGVDISAHVERYATGVLESGTQGCTMISLQTTYPAGTPWLTTGSIESGKTELVVADGTFWENGDPIEVAGAGAAGATLVTTVAGGARTTKLTLNAAASTTVVAAKITGVSAGVRYYNSAKYTTVLNHRAQGHHYAARFEGALSNEHTAWNAGVKTALFSGAQLNKNNAIELLTTGRVSVGQPQDPSFLGAESVATATIKNLAVTGPKLGNESVAAEKIANLTVVAAKIAKETITGEKLANATVTTKQLKITAAEAPKELKENTAIEATSAGTVYLSVLFNAEETVGEVIVDGVSLYKIRKEVLAASSDNAFFAFRIKAAGKFEVKMTTGKIQTSTTTLSVYNFQEG